MVEHCPICDRKTVAGSSLVIGPKSNELICRLCAAAERDGRDYPIRNAIAADGTLYVKRDNVK